jgi:hypothetical protein
MNLQGGTAMALLAGPLEAKRNGTGVFVNGGVLGSQGGPVEISENEFGVIAWGSDAVADICCSIADVSKNSDTGLLAQYGGTISFDGTLTENGTAVRAWENGRVELGGIDCSTNELGVLVHGGTAYIRDSTINGNTSGDVNLTFGSRVNFDGVNDVGNIDCDDTVLVEGDVSCPTAKSLTGKRIQIERVPTDRLQPTEIMAPRWIE